MGREGPRRAIAVIRFLTDALQVGREDAGRALARVWDARRVGGGVTRAIARIVGSSIHEALRDGRVNLDRERQTD